MKIISYTEFYAILRASGFSCTYNNGRDLHYLLEPVTTSKNGKIHHIFWNEKNVLKFKKAYVKKMTKYAWGKKRMI